MIELIDKEEAISICNAEVWEGEALANMKNCKPVLTIPENPTNGDMLKAMFPNIDFDYKIWWDNLYFKDTDWWNAPYEQESKDE